MRIDEIDIKIIASLVANGRASFREIGEEVGLSAPAVKRRVDRLLDERVITGFTARVNPDAVGWHSQAFVSVTYAGNVTPARIRRILEPIPQVAAAYTVSGDADVLVRIRAADMADFETALERLRADRRRRQDRIDHRAVHPDRPADGDRSAGLIRPAPGPPSRGEARRRRCGRMRPEQEVRSMRRGVIFGLAAYLIWGLFPLYWPLLEPATAAELLAQRMFWSAVIMFLVVTAMRRWRQVRALPAKTWGLVAAAAAAISVNWGVYIFAVNNGHVVDASLGYFITPLVSVAFGLLLLHESLRPMQWAASGRGGARRGGHRDRGRARSPAGTGPERQLRGLRADQTSHPDPPGHLFDRRVRGVGASGLGLSDLAGIHRAGNLRRVRVGPHGIVGEHRRGDALSRCCCSAPLRVASHSPCSASCSTSHPSPSSCSACSGPASTCPRCAGSDSA